MSKRARRVIVVFASAPEDCAHAVDHVAAGAQGLPIWLFTAQPPPDGTAARCERVTIEPSSGRLTLRIVLSLWPCWVALSVTAWTGKHEPWPLKLLPFLIPPFRILVMNEHRGFFSGSMALVFRHLKHRVLDFIRDRALWTRDRIVILWYKLLLAWASLERSLSTARYWARGFGLLLVGALARRSGAFARFVLARHGGQRLVLGDLAPSGTGIAFFQYRQKNTDWNELERLAVSSDCRWILLLEQGAAQESVEDMLPLFEDNRTFAISRQAGLRPWKSRLLTLAPFRALLPGEACQVLAPVSHCILVDRLKLLGLGIPRTCYAGTGWLLLFWKAAAAGFRSYSVAGSPAQNFIPSWPVHESEFLIRLLEDPKLRTIGPVEPDLARGSVAFSIGRAQPRRDRPKVLVVSPYLPYPLTHGGAVRIYNLCRALSDRVDFLLVSFLEKQDQVDYAKLHELFREVYLVDREDDPLPRRSLPRQVRDHHSRSMSGLIARVCAEQRPDLVQVEYTHMAGFRQAAPHVPSILVEHDVTFTLYRQVAERTGRRADRSEYRRWLNFERQCFQDYDALWTMSEEDRNIAVANGASEDRTSVIPNGVDINRLIPWERPAAAPEILYVGSFRHFPNVMGFEKLLNEVMPHVWRRYPEATLVAVAGPEPEARLREFREGHRLDLDPRVQLHGFVGDLRPLYAQASVVVAPLVVSAGTNIKVLEAMSCGKAIVATPVAVNGLGLHDNQSVLIRSDWFEFAEAVATCLASAEVRARIGQSARRIVEQRFDWGKIADRAHESYLRLAATGQHLAPLPALGSVQPARLAANRFRPSARL